MQQTPSISTEPEDATQETAIISPEKHSGWRSALTTIGILVAAPIVALLLTSFVFQSYEVDGPSMETTLQHRDRLIVWKMPRTLAKLTRQAYVPARSDIIVFVKPELSETGGGQNKQLIKRVVGLPGDRIVVQDGRITIYNPQHPDGYNPDINQEFSQNIATLTTGNIDVVILPGQVFVAGDNRTNSLDSRSFGAINVNDIVGKLTIRIFPVSKFKSYI